jgi:hypothetical protein
LWNADVFGGSHRMKKESKDNFPGSAHSNAYQKVQTPTLLFYSFCGTNPSLSVITAAP